MVQLILASSSLRRAQLLRQLNIEFQVCAPEIDETPKAYESPIDYVSRLARAKAAFISDRAFPILGADTTVVFGGCLLGKPECSKDVFRMLSALSGKCHEVVTAVCVTLDGLSTLRVVHSSVWLRVLEECEIQRYCETEEPYDKAGGYGLQSIGAVFVERIHGSPSNVMGLPLLETELLLRNVGVDTWSNR